MLRWIGLAFVLLPVLCIGQAVITGKVVNLTDKKPVVNASVFLSNATVGTATAANGSFTLNNIRNGQYDLVVSIIGYETYHQTVLVNNASITLPPIEMVAKVTALREVSIHPDANWDFYYRTFKRYFLGTSGNAAKCKILNPEILDFDYDGGKRILKASTTDFLIIENQALGYRIKYLLTKFANNQSEGYTFFGGSVLFEDLKGSPSQMRRWRKKRVDAYEGSSMQFLRAIIANQVPEDGFKVLCLIRKPNPDYVSGPNNRYLETLINKPLHIYEYAETTDIKGIYALSYAHSLYIMYTKKRDLNNAEITEHLRMPDYLATIGSLSKPYVLFDKNGIVLDPEAITFEGSWTRSLVAELLPVDYEPTAK